MRGFTRIYTSVALVRFMAFHLFTPHTTTVNEMSSKQVFSEDAKEWSPLDMSLKYSVPSDVPMSSCTPESPTRDANQRMLPNSLQKAAMTAALTNSFGLPTNVPQLYDNINQHARSLARKSLGLSMKRDWSRESLPLHQGSEEPMVELVDNYLWKKFHSFGTEMVITKSGRYFMLYCII